MELEVIMLPYVFTKVDGHLGIYGYHNLHRNAMAAKQNKAFVDIVQLLKSKLPIDHELAKSLMYSIEFRFADSKLIYSVNSIIEIHIERGGNRVWAEREAMAYMCKIFECLMS